MFVPWAGGSVRVCAMKAHLQKGFCDRESCLQGLSLRPVTSHCWIILSLQHKLNIWEKGGKVSVEHEHARWRRLVCGGVCMYRGRNLFAWQRQVLELTGVQQRQQGSLGPALPRFCQLQKGKAGNRKGVKMVQLVVALFLLGQALGHPSQTRPILPSDPFLNRYH